MKRIRQILAQTRGFTFAETLAALLILTMLGGLVISGITSASTTYRDEQFVSQSEILGSTIDTALSDPVRLMEQDSEGDWALIYNGIAVAKPQLVIRTSDEGKGVLYIEGVSPADKTESASVKLLNEGIYGDCEIAQLKVFNDTGAVQNVSSISLSPRTTNPTVNPTDRAYKDAVSGIYEIAGLDDHTNLHEYYFVPLVNLPKIEIGATDGEASVKSINKANVSDVGDQVYTGSAITPSVSVTLNGTELVEGQDFTLGYSGNLNVGEATITITGIGDYGGVIIKTFNIMPKSISACTVTIVSPQAYTGNPVTLSESAIAVVDPDIDAPQGRTLKLGQDFTLSYLNNTDIGTATAIVTGIGNYTDSVNGSFDIAQVQIVRINIANADVTGIVDPTAYTGQPITQNPTVKYGDKTLTLGLDYDLSYENNTNVGTATLIITGRDKYEGEKRIEFAIVDAGSGGDDSDWAQTLKDKPETSVTTDELALAANWWGSDYVWKLKRDINGEPFLASKFKWGDNYNMVLYKGTYYKSQQSNGSGYYDQSVNIPDNALDISWLGGETGHNVGGVVCRWLKL